VLVARFTSPVEALIISPVVDVNVPATPPPEYVGRGFVSLEQYGVPAYENVATGSFVIVIEAVAIIMPHPAELIVFVTV
jgi:hypothetical protein